METNTVTSALNGMDSVVADVVREFPLHDAPAPANGWGPREVMAHFLFWHSWWAETAEALAASRPAAGLNASIDELNDRAVAQRAGAPISELAAELQALHQRLHQAVLAIPDRESALWPRINQPSIPIQERLAGMARHLQSHLDEVRQGGPLSR